jgi:hypothetical protein
MGSYTQWIPKNEYSKQAYIRCKLFESVCGSQIVIRVEQEY